VAIEEQITDKSTLGDFVWYDTNGDGIKEPGELGINGVIINLYDSTGLITTTVTMSDTDGIGERWKAMITLAIMQICPTTVTRLGW